MAIPRCSRKRLKASALNTRTVDNGGKAGMLLPTEGRTSCLSGARHSALKMHTASQLYMFGNKGKGMKKEEINEGIFFLLCLLMK